VNLSPSLPGIRSMTSVSPSLTLNCRLPALITAYMEKVPPRLLRACHPGRTRRPCQRQSPNWRGFGRLARGLGLCYDRKRASHGPTSKSRKEGPPMPALHDVARGPLGRRARDGGAHCGGRSGLLGQQGGGEGALGGPAAEPHYPPSLELEPVHIELHLRVD